MTRAQEQAASAARRDCIAWMRANSQDMSRADHNEALSDGWLAYVNMAWSVSEKNEARNAYLAAWRATWETA